MINPKLGTALRLLALILIAFLANWFISLIPAGNKGVDLTEDKVHTISDGTKAILKELDAPVTINYYATRKSSYLPKQVKVYMKKVDSFLKQYQSLSEGQIRIVYLDPQPDTDAEDSANLDGISGQRLNDENIYFGLSVQCLDQKSTIPFLNPSNETMLEFDLSSAISEVALANKPVIGIISPLPIAGSSMPAMPGQPAPPQAWMIHQQLSQQYQVVELGMTPGEISPAEISALLVIHPADITPEAEFSIDQYLLQGGTVIAALDAFSVTAAQSQPLPQNPMMPVKQGGIPTSSNLPTLLKAWGVNFKTDQVVADARYRTQLQQGLAVSIMSLPREAIVDEDAIITKGINDLFIPFAGTFTLSEVTGITSTVMVQTSPEASFVDPERATRLDSDLALEMKPTGEQYPLIVRLQGSFPSAFPLGAPQAETAESTEDEASTISNLTQASAEGTLFLLADTDFFSDQFGYRIQNVLGTRMATPQGSNTALVQNIVDLSVGSKHLIGARSRVPSRRPFTVVKEMEAKFEKIAGEKVAQLQEEEQLVIEKIKQLQSSNQANGSILINPGQQAELAGLREQEIDFRRQLRDLQKDLQSEKDALSNKVTLANVVIMPALILLIGLAVYFRRSVTTRAK